MATRYITTAIPYVNARPHIGFALELVLADALARSRRQCGDAVRFQTGTDDNSLSNVRAAERAGVPIAQFVERHASAFEALREPLGLSHDDFVRTSRDPRHEPAVRRLWESCAANGDIDKRSYRGSYCVGCEAFYAPGQACPDHAEPLEEVAEENWFFRLSRYAPELERLISTGRLRIVPESRRNEALSFVRGGLQDLSISRSRERAKGWGLEVPADPEQVVYVWFDALANYISTLGYATDGDDFRRWWAGADTTHVIGKGILRFHAVYWPAFLLSAGLPLPSELLVHGYVTVDGEKISKSRSNTVDPVDVAERYGTDVLRYFLLRHIRSSQDGDFSVDRLKRARDADLADGLGNLVQRTVALTQKFADGRVPEPPPSGPHEKHLIALCERAGPRIAEAVDRFALHDALGAIWEIVDEANVYVVRTAPWRLAREPGAESALAASLYTLLETLRVVAHHLSPFLPSTAEVVAQRVGGQPGGSSWGSARPGTPVLDGEPLFPKGSEVVWPGRR